MRILAYIDVPSGSVIFQFLIAGLLGLSVAFRSFWRKAWDLLAGRARRGKKQGTDGSPAPGGSGSSDEVPAGKA